ncbi:MAG: GNAT family N-acetyltransferase [Firmicutes bacterium]|nr:GNAT family N-acetyltransferase [Bacillota bacterium]
MIEIKKCALQDLERLVELESQLFPAGEAATRESFSYRIEHHGYWFRTARVEGKLVGYICGRPVFIEKEGGITDEMYLAQDYPKGDAFALLDIAVDNAYQRQGIGEFLMKTIIFLCQEDGIRRIVLACKEDKKPYYEKFGFHLMGPSASDLGGEGWYDMERIL